MGEHLKRSMVTMIQFRLDNMVKNVLASMNNRSVTISYTSNIDALLQSLQLPDTDRKNQILRILQYMRNTYHNNGTHLFGKLLNLQIENYSFIFDKNCSIDCASWAHVTTALKATFEVLGERSCSSTRLINHNFPSQMSMSLKYTDGEFVVIIRSRSVISR